MADQDPAPRTHRERAKKLREWAIDARVEAEGLHDKGKMALIELVPKGSYTTWQRFENGTWVRQDKGGAWVLTDAGEPKQATLDRYIRTWFTGSRRTEHELTVARIMGFKIMEGPPAEAPGGDVAPTYNARRINRLLAAPDEMVPPRLKRRVDRQLGAIYNDYLAEAAEEGWPVLGEDSGQSTSDSAG